MTLDDLQLTIDQRLAANSTLARVDRFIEFDSRLTPDQLAAQDERFERVMATKGLAIVILSPFGRPKDSVQRASAWAMTVPVAIVENPVVNRGAADPVATPPRTPLALRPALALQAAIGSLMGLCSFPDDAALARPNLGEDGFVHFFLLPVVDVKISS